MQSDVSFTIHMAYHFNDDICIIISIYIICIFLLQVVGPFILRRLVKPDLLPHAVAYTAIRGASAPFAVVAQALCLAAQDTCTPAVGTGVACVFNLIADLVLVGLLGGGCRAAAAATAISEVLSCTIVLYRMFSNQTLLDVRKISSQFKWTNTVAYFKDIGPVLIAIICHTISLAVISFFAARLTTISLAAHQVLLRIFFFFAIFGDTLSQAALTFVPHALYVDRQQSNKDVSIKKLTESPFNKLLHSLLQVAVFVSVMNAVTSLLFAQRLVHCMHLFSL